MSEQLTPAEPDVLTGHTELINSTNIERIVAGRDAALEQIKAVIQRLADISTRECWRTICAGLGNA